MGGGAGLDVKLAAFDYIIVAPRTMAGGAPGNELQALGIPTCVIHPKWRSLARSFTPAAAPVAPGQRPATA